MKPPTNGSPVCSATAAVNCHARRVGSLRTQRHRQLKPRDGKCPGLRRGKFKATMWSLMMLHLRRLIGKRVSRPLEAFGAFGIAVGAVAFQAATSQIGERDHCDLSRRLDLHYPRQDQALAHGMGSSGAHLPRVPYPWVFVPQDIPL